MNHFSQTQPTRLAGRRPGRLAATVAIFLGGFLLASLLAVQPADASQSTGSQLTNPCPQWSIQGVFNDPGSDWDRDRVPNGIELEHGENPCVPVTTSFCVQQPSLCTFRYLNVSSVCSYGTYWDIAMVNADPNSDWDNDGIKNRHEANNGANPCAHPCPRPTSIDVALNPNADWDNDRYSNAIEVFNGTNPCSAPAVTVIYPTTIYPPMPKPIPVVVVNLAPANPPAGYTCPAGYPYYYPSTGWCHATPLRTY